MRKDVDEFFSDFHRRFMRPRGYRKGRHRFSRAMDGYSEVFDFQGSRYNESSGPWRFFINVKVVFPDIEDRLYVRIENIVAGAAQQYDLPDPVPVEFGEEMAALLASASDSIAAQLPQIHDAYRRKRYWVGF
jgi:hypothetical protein